MKQCGFSLMELMVTVAIVAILASIAIPSYRSYIIRANRTVAKTALLEVAAKQESYFTDHKGYAVYFDRLGYGASASSASTAYVDTQGKISLSNTGAIYTLMLTGVGTMSSCAGLSGAAGGLAFAISAAPTGTQIDAICGTICVSQTGERGTTAGASKIADCWGR